MITPDPLEMYGVGIGIVSQTAAVVWCSSRVSLRVISRRVARCALSFQAPYSTESTPLPRARPPHREEQVRPSEPSRERQQWGVLPEGCEGIVGTTMTVLGALFAGVAASLLVTCANEVGFLFVIQVLPGLFS